MINLVIPHRYDGPHKTWLVKYSKCHHYYLSQAIDGRRIYPYTRVSRHRVSEATMRTPSELKQLINYE